MSYKLDFLNLKWVYILEMGRVKRIIETRKEYIYNLLITFEPGQAGAGWGTATVEGMSDPRTIQNKCYKLLKKAIIGAYKSVTSLALPDIYQIN